MIWRSIVRPLLFCLSAERAHHFSMKALAVLHKVGLAAPILHSTTNIQDERLRVNVAGIDFPNPIGLAAGFDKNAEWFSRLALLGFGHIEVGSITGEAQPGNPRPRLFRLPQDRGLINRMGFNNSGAAVAARHLDSPRTKKFRQKHVLGINIGKTKVVPLENANDDYIKSLGLLYPFADYFTINVSSPNTPGLRKLQNRDPLMRLLHSVGQLNSEMAAKRNHAPKPVFLKIAPDMQPEQLSEIVSIARNTPVDGLVATNTTVSRSGLVSSDATIERMGAGGLSGRPLTARSREVVAHLYAESKGEVPIIGVGGIFDGADAWQMICAGASIVQIYTGFVYGGPLTVKRISRYLISMLDQHGLNSIGNATGTRLDLSPPESRASRLKVPE